LLRTPFNPPLAGDQIGAQFLTNAEGRLWFKFEIVAKKFGFGIEKIRVIMNICDLLGGGLSASEVVFRSLGVFSKSRKPTIQPVSVGCDVLG
jgi:hypothetical protein